MFANPWIAALIALFTWWFSTGAILWLVRQAERYGVWGPQRAALLALPLLGIGFRAIAVSGESAPYLGFFGALAVWGWIELAFLTGLITGPNRLPAKIGMSEVARLRAAWGTIAWHELALAIALISIISMSSGAADKTALWTFLVLYFARISAKLNFFLGVPRHHIEFLPEGIAHMGTYFRSGGPGWFYAASNIALTFAVFCWIERYMATGGIGFALLGTMTALALLEHWLMVLPLPDEKLWRWMIPAPAKTTLKRRLSEDANGL
ncbi:MAG: putative photosynthetic complex assembly protein PuhE [Pseudomonadota bacterium]